MDTKWQPDLSGYDGPKYLGLVRALRDAVRGGSLGPGHRLPPVRTLAWSLGITPGTVARAYQIATQEGLLDATVGRGTFVARNRPRFGADQALIPEAPALLRPPVAPGHPLIDLRSPQLPDVGQNESMARALEAMIVTPCRQWSPPARGGRG